MVARNIRNAPGGPLLKDKVRPLSVRKAGCYRVLMRRLRAGPNHGRWEPISTSGFTVVCASRLEACELVWMVGGRHFPRPDSVVHNDDHDEERYLEWLLHDHFRIEPYQAGQPLECMFSEFVRGWYPGPEDIPGLKQGSRSGPMIEQALRARWSGH